MAGKIRCKGRKNALQTGSLPSIILSSSSSSFERSGNADVVAVRF
jgi:hypothetical protein